MSTKPLIAVAGAAGKQGRSVAAALLRSGGGGGRVRALTRNPNASQARLLAQAGAEVVAAPLLWDRRRHG